MLRLTLFGSFALTQADGEAIPIKSRRARALLAYLALSPQMTRSREEIMALLWSERAETQARGSLRQVLTGLRKDLGDAAQALKADVDKVSLVPGQIAIAETQGGELLAGFHLNDPAFEEWLRDERQARVGAPQAEVDLSPEAPDIAVLPFDTSPADPEHQAFSDGITEDIVTELTRFREFMVYAPWSSFHDPGDEMTTEEIGRKLDVDYVVEGSVRHAGGRVRITAMLFDLETVNHVWVQRYDRKLEDIFDVQEEVAREVSTAVAIKVESDACALAAARKPEQRTALDHVLLGERAQQRDWNAQDALSYYEAALRADPNCARAYANLANWHSCSGQTLFADMDQARDLTRELAEKALSLQPGDALVLAIVADAYASIGDFTAARQCLDKALALNPNHHAVMGFAASTLPWLGEVEEAVTWLERYQRHDPLWQATAMEVAFEVYYMAGRYEEAVAAIARMIDLPQHLLPLAAAAQAKCGHLDEAERLRLRYEAELPKGQSFEHHILQSLRLTAHESVVDQWLDGLRKAGFSF
jgi:TolB-like protein